MPSICADVLQRPPQHCKAIFLQLKKKRERENTYTLRGKEQQASNFSHVSSIDWLFAEEESLLAQKYKKKIARTSLAIREIKIKPKRSIG